MKLYCFCGFLLFWVYPGTTQDLPIIITTWSSTTNATIKAWDLLYNQGQDIVDSLVGGCEECDLYKLCGTAVGYGDVPSDTGEVTLDAMVMDGRTHKVGSVGCLRRVKNAIGVAHAVLKHTDNTLLVGDLAKDFALQMGFPEEDLSSSRSDTTHSDWLANNCQPNNWNNVTPDPDTSCGPYTPLPVIQEEVRQKQYPVIYGEPESHDTISMVGIDVNGDPATTCTTNGLTHKIAGRVGDCPIVGAGSYAEAGIGAAGATGNGDIMMRFLPTFHIVNLMGQGMTPQEAADTVAAKMGAVYPNLGGAVTAVNTTGGYGASCYGLGNFPFHIINPTTGGIREMNATCVG